VSACACVYVVCVCVCDRCALPAISRYYARFILSMNLVYTLSNVNPGTRYVVYAGLYCMPSSGLYGTDR
jgi:hypothetical protein